MLSIAGLKQIWQANSQSDYILAIGIFLVTVLILRFIKIYVLAKAKKLTQKTKTDLDDYAVEFLDEIHWPFYVFMSAFIAMRWLVVPPMLQTLINYSLLILGVYYIGRGLSKIVVFLEKRHITKEKVHDTHFIKLMAKIVKAIIWLFAILFLLSNLGVNVTSFVAGLGIGGIAIAFALQNILGDLFAAFTIYFDKPFKVGDFIIIGNDMGTIKKIGLKSTRLQALQGQELVISNQELTSARVNNYKKMEKRRIVFGFGVEYSTPVEKLKAIPAMIEKMFASIEHATCDRIHFKEFADSSLNFEAVYYLDSKEYNVYMDTQQDINLAIKQVFEENEISMAFPTRTIYTKKID